VKLRKCPNIPLEPLDDLVLNILATELLTDAKITSMVTMLRESLAAKLKPAKARLLGLQKKQQALKLAIEVLYDQISSQMIKPDDHFYEYLNKKKRELLAVEQEISQTKSELAFPVKNSVRLKSRHFALLHATRFEQEEHWRKVFYACLLSTLLFKRHKSNLPGAGSF
jgi:hypothetical protein